MPLSFWRKISRKQKYSIYWKSPSIFYQQRSPFWGEIHCVKEPTPVLLTIHFSAAMKTLVIYSSLLDLPSHLHRQFARGIMTRRRRLSYSGTLPYCHLSNNIIMVTSLLRSLFVTKQNCHTLSYEKPLLMWSPVTCTMANCHILKSQTVESSILSLYSFKSRKLKCLWHVNWWACSFIDVRLHYTYNAFVAV